VTYNLDCLSHHLTVGLRLNSLSGDVYADSINARTEVDVYLTDTSRDTESLHKFPVVKSLFLKYNTALPSSAPVAVIRFGRKGHRLVYIVSERQKATSSHEDNRILSDKHPEHLFFIKQW